MGHDPFAPQVPATPRRFTATAEPAEVVDVELPDTPEEPKNVAPPAPTPQPAPVAPPSASVEETKAPASRTTSVPVKKAAAKKVGPIKRTTAKKSTDS